MSILQVQMQPLIQLSPQPVRPDPALKLLDRLVGTWELIGRTLDSEDDNVTGWTKFEWLPGGFFLKSVGEVKLKGTRIHRLELIGYDPVSGTFPSSVYSNRCSAALAFEWVIQDDIVIHQDPFSIYRGKFSRDGHALFGGWRPKYAETDGLEIAYDAIMTRIKGGPVP